VTTSPPFSPPGLPSVAGASGDPPGVVVEMKVPPRRVEPWAAVSGVLSIDLHRVAANLGRIAAMVGGVDRIAAVVKSDAYGLGAGEIARTAVEAGVRRLVVLHAAEAIALEAAIPPAGAARGPSDPPAVRFLAIAAAPPDGAEPLVARGGIEVAVHDGAAVRAAAAVARRAGAILPVHVEIDCGLGRAGVRPAAAPALVEAVLATDGLRLAGVFTHFSASESDPDRTTEEAECFRRTLEAIGPARTAGALVHAANTHATLGRDDLRFACCRIGRGWAGLGPATARLEPVLRWTCPVMHVRRVEAGDPVGYGGRWVADEATWIGLLPVGYAHGLPEGAGGQGLGVARTVGGRGRLLGDPGGAEAIEVPFVGTVSMDQCAIALPVRDDPDGRRLRPGATVEIVGGDRSASNRPEAFAAACGVRPLALLSSIGPRLHRRYEPIQASAGPTR